MYILPWVSKPWTWIDRYSKNLMHSSQFLGAWTALHDNKHPWMDLWTLDWVVVLNIFYFHPNLGKIPILTNIFQMGWNHQLVEIAWVNVNFWHFTDRKRFLKNRNRFDVWCFFSSAVFVEEFPCFRICQCFWHSYMQEFQTQMVYDITNDDWWLVMWLGFMMILNQEVS